MQMVVTTWVCHMCMHESLSVALLWWGWVAPRTQDRHGKRTSRVQSANCSFHVLDFKVTSAGFGTDDPLKAFSLTDCLNFSKHQQDWMWNYLDIFVVLLRRH